MKIKLCDKCLKVNAELLGSSVYLPNGQRDKVDLDVAKEMLKKGLSKVMIARHFGVTTRNIQRIFAK